MSVALLISILLVGFGLGLLHALDPDHLMTISTLSARPQPRGATIRYAASWAMGHGGLLIVVAAAVLLFGWTMPSALPLGAERSVGLILIGVGLVALWHLQSHRLESPSSARAVTIRERAPFLIGLVHGLAGSASLLALIPVTLYHPAVGFAYAIIFSIGVLVAMMSFGLLFDRLQRALSRNRPQLHRFVRLAIGVSAIGMGTLWLRAA